jgi:hypothetical protein
MSELGHRYNPKEVAGLARRRRVVPTMRVVNWLVNHDYDAAQTLVVRMDGEDWYLKFYVGDDRGSVNVWSCWWQGAAH